LHQPLALLLLPLLRHLLQPTQQRLRLRRREMQLMLLLLLL
jgi:hypothetical protein